MSNTFYNFSNINFNLKTLSSIFFNKDTKMSVLDPLTCIIRCAILSNKPYGTKISIIDNRITFHDPNVLQGTIRWTQGDKREDLHNIYNPIVKSCKWYNSNNQDILNIYRLAKVGLEKLKKSYESSSIISHSLELYIKLLEEFINKKNNTNKNEEIYDSNIIENEEEKDNKIYKELKNMWDEKQVSIINNIFTQIEHDKKYKNYWLNALDIILMSKEVRVKEIIEKNTTQLV